MSVRGNQLTATGNHMLYRITQCYLPPSSGDFPTFTPAEASGWFSNPEGMQGWVELGGDYILDSLPIKDGHLSKK